MPYRRFAGSLGRFSALIFVLMFYASTALAQTAGVVTSSFLNDLIDDGASALRSFDLKIGGPDVAQYTFKVGVANSTDCSVRGYYARWRLVRERLLLDISRLPDGLVTLCLVGRGVVNGQLRRQKEPTVYQWRKDTTLPPPSSGPRAVIASPGFLNDILLDGTSDRSALNLKVDGLNRANEYTYKVDIGEGDCTLQDGYGTWRGTSKRLLQNISSFPNGTVTLCLAGRWMTRFGARDRQETPTVYQWVKAVPPEGFQILEPLGPIQESTPTVSWEYSVGASTYNLTIATDAQCTSEVASFPDLTDTNQVITPPLPDGTYYICVSAGDSVGNFTPASNNGLAMTVDTVVPESFNILRPSAEGEVYNHTPLILWTQSRDTNFNRYAGAIVTELPCRAPVPEPAEAVREFTVGDVTETAGVLSPPLDNGNYYACLAAIDNAGNFTLASNNGIAFTVLAGLPGPFEIVDPTGSISENTPVVRWTPSTNAETYNLTIATDAQGTTEVVSAQTDTNLFLTPPLPDGDYFIFVHAFNSSGNETAANNNGMMFTVETLDTIPPGPFEILSPTGLITDNTPTIEWAAAGDADVYQLSIIEGSSCGGAVVAQADNLATTSYTLTTPLADWTYSSCVTARDAAGNMTHASNNGLEFQVDALDDTPPGPFNILGPVGVIDDDTPTVTWEAALEADFYDLTIASDASCTPVVASFLDLTNTIEWDLSSPLPDGDYYTCVDARDFAGNVTSANNNGLAFTVVDTGVDDPSGTSLLGKPITIASEMPGWNDEFTSSTTVLVEDTVELVDWPVTAEIWDIDIGDDTIRIVTCGDGQCGQFSWGSNSDGLRIEIPKLPNGEPAFNYINVLPCPRCGHSGSFQILNETEEPPSFGSWAGKNSFKVRLFGAWGNMSTKPELKSTVLLGVGLASEGEELPPNSVRVP